jgi:hypothetical protein
VHSSINNHRQAYTCCIEIRFFFGIVAVLAGGGREDEGVMNVGSWVSFNSFVFTFKGLYHEMNIIILKGYYDKNVLSVHALIVFTFFCILLE